MSHFCDAWDGRARNTRCSGSRCRSWAVVKYSTDNTGTIGHGFLTIGYYCKACILPVIEAHPDDFRPRPLESMSANEVRDELAARGINTSKAWGKVKAALDKIRERTP